MLNDFLTQAALRSPESEAIRAGGATLTYAQLAHDATAVAGSLYASGVRAADRVVVFSPNTITAAIGFWGVVMCGGVAVMVGSRTPAHKLAWMLADADAAALITDESVVDVAVGAGLTQLRSVIVAGPPSALSDLSRLAYAVALDDAIADGSAADDLGIPIGADLAALIYTSGSSGEPKAVMVTHENVDAAASAICGYLDLTSRDVLLCALPLSFDYGLYQMIMSVKVRARLVLERSFELPGQILNTIARERVTVFPGVPTMFAILAKLPSLQRWDLTGVRTITSTGSALATELVDWLRRAFPRAQIFSMYGLTECKRCTYLPPGDLERKPGSVGVVIPGNEIWLVDGDDRVVAAGEVGQLVVRGPTVMAGYWRRPDETARRLRPGPESGESVLYTGDLCRLDADGYLYFVSRMDDVIKSRGEKVAPAEVEAALRSSPGVLEAAVVGRPHEILGQAIHAFVVVDDRSAVTPAVLRAACGERLEPFMVPQAIEIVDTIPRTAHGKIEKAALVISPGLEATARTDRRTEAEEMEECPPSSR
ncbi:MAG: class I adenylate-forming enzyme family protein [Solirubrobacteraceae bacterium]